MPKVSVIMGTHNGVRTLKRAIDSILSQTLDDLEFIICDDKSTDGTLDLLNQIAANDSRVVVLHNSSNMGLSASLNRCIEVSRSNYIARMDDDDISHPDRLMRQYDFITQHPEYSIVGCCRQTFDNEGVWEVYSNFGELTKCDIISGNIFTHPTVFMNANDVRRVGGYTVSARTMRGQDFDMWCKMYVAGWRGYIMPDILFDYFEDRNRVKEIKWKSRYYNFKTHMIWRRKMGLPFKYDIYAYKELVAMILPGSLLVKYKQSKRRKR